MHVSHAIFVALTIVMACAPLVTAAYLWIERPQGRFNKARNKGYGLKASLLVLAWAVVASPFVYITANYLI